MMKKNLNTIVAILVILVSVAYQIHCAIHGFDLTDEGYLMSLYQWFRIDVDSAQGAGGYPLTCYLGSLLDGATGTVIGMRLWGIVIVTLTEIMLFLYLRKFFTTPMLLMGLLMQVVFVSGDPKPFGYNTLTAIIGLSALILTIEGALRCKFILLVLGGGLLGVNVFIRLPNVTGLAFLLVPFLVPGWQWRHELRASFLASLWMLLGFVFSFVITWQFIKVLGADGQTTALIASIPEMMDGTSTHASSSMLSKYWNNYILTIISIFVFALAVLMAAWAFTIRNKVLKVVVWVATFFFLYFQTYRSSDMLGSTLLSMMNGLGIAGCGYYFWTDKCRRTLAMVAILASFVFPLGSDGGFMTMWIGTWMSLPIGLSGLADFLRSGYTMEIYSGHTFIAGMRKRRLPLCHLYAGYMFCLVTLIVALFVKIEHKSYYDPGDRFKKTITIHSEKAVGISISKERADIINPLLDELKKYVKPGDTMLVYDSSPMLYYLTDTRPFAGVSWPCVFYGENYVCKFQKAEKTVQQMPVLVMQFFSTSNEWSNVKPRYYSEKGDGYFSSNEMKRNILRFIRQYNYHEMWSNRYYSILIPQSKEE